MLAHSVDGRMPAHDSVFKWPSTLAYNFSFFWQEVHLLVKERMINFVHLQMKNLLVWCTKRLNEVVVHTMFIVVNNIVEPETSVTMLNYNIADNLALREQCSAHITSFKPVLISITTSWWIFLVLLISRLNERLVILLGNILTHGWRLPKC